MIKKIMILFIFLVICFIPSITVYAKDPLDRKGSIEITLKEGTDNYIEGAEITIYHIADAVNDNGNLAYSLREELGTCDINLNDLTDKDLVSNVSKCDIGNAVKHIDSTNEDGVVKFEELDLGLYFIKQTNSVNGYSDFDSFLIAIPKIENDAWVYDVKAKPKTDIYKVIDVVIEKKWNSHSNNIPKQVTIELYNDEELVATVILNDENNWTYTFERLMLSDKYHVKEINIPDGYTPSYKVNDYVFTVTNTDTLADTGQIFYPIIIFFVLGFSLILTGLRLIRSEEKN